jgi:hypothetical protein
VSRRRRYSVTVGHPGDQARLERGARMLGHRSMSSFFKTAALAYLDIVEAGLESARRAKEREARK